MNSYKAEELKLNIQLGERVHILRKAEEDECGWENGWSGQMNKYIDTMGIIVHVHEGCGGVRVRHYDGMAWYYPYFVLDFIDR